MSYFLSERSSSLFVTSSSAKMANLDAESYGVAFVLHFRASLTVVIPKVVETNRYVFPTGFLSFPKLKAHDVGFELSKTVITVPTLRRLSCEIKIISLDLKSILIKRIGIKLCGFGDTSRRSILTRR